MYGFGLIQGLVVTMKNLVLPGRMFTVHQYPNRKVGLFGLAKASGTSVLSYVLKEPRMAARALAGLATVEDRMPQHPRFRGEEFTFYEGPMHRVRQLRKVLPVGNNPHRYPPQR